MKNELKCLIGVPTFRRPQFLPRIIACFDRLNYDNKKMVIINDDIDTKYHYNGDLNIEIVNIDNHLPLAVKRNMFACWDFDILFPLDDDDLFLPERLNNHVSKYMEDGNIDLYRNRCHIYVTKSKMLKKILTSAFTNSSFTKNGFFKSGGYTNHYQSNHDDVTLRKNFKTKCNCKIEVDISKLDFIYQFDGGRVHNTQNRDVLMSDDILKRGKSQQIQSGNIELVPDFENYDNILKLVDETILKGETNIEIYNNHANYRSLK